MSQEILDACKAASAIWKNSFNKGDARGCALQYAENTEMRAKPFGTYKGRDEIEAFWQDLISKGFAEVEYINEKWEPEGEDGYVLSSEWTMNKAYGLVHREYFQVQADGKALLVDDEFEVLGER